MEIFTFLLIRLQLLLFITWRDDNLGIHMDWFILMLRADTHSSASLTLFI